MTSVNRWSRDHCPWVVTRPLTLPKAGNSGPMVVRWSSDHNLCGHVTVVYGGQVTMVQGFRQLRDQAGDSGPMVVRWSRDHYSWVHVTIIHYS